jgi:hypothetical protein
LYEVPGIGFGIDSHAAQTQRTQRPDDAAGDLAAIGDREGF